MADTIPTSADRPQQDTEYRTLLRFPGYRIGRDGSVWSHHLRRAMRPFSAGNGYLMVALRVDGRYVRVYVHRLVAEAFIGEPPSGQDVCHNDNDRRNNVASNLRYDTRSGNLADRDRHGTHQRGQQNPTAKLTDAEAQEIRTLRAQGVPLKDLAARFRVRESTVSRIANGIRRKEVVSGG